MKLIFAFAATCALLFAVAPAAAQEGMRTCQYDLECGVGEYCDDRGRCNARGSTAEGGEQSADNACGSDRRCRIDRLKRKNEAIRHAAVVEEERQVRDLLEREERERLKDRPRLDKPLSGDIRVSRLGVLGLHAGYVFAGRLQPEAEFSYLSRYVYVPTQDGSFGVDGYLDVWFFRFGASYFLLDGWFSPYLTAGFQLGTGNFSSYSNFASGDVVSSSQLGTRFHAGEVGAGIDLQFKFGMHTRLGLAYRHLIYNQARYGPASYDPLSQEGLAEWYREAAAIDVIWLVGWAI